MSAASPTVQPLPLRLVATHPTSTQAAAWLLPGDDPARWLDEIAHWQVPMAEIRLLLLPASATSRAVNGVLAFMPKPPLVAPTPWAMPYQELADGIYAPAAATLTPPISREELRRKIVWPFAVFQPSLGLVGCRADDLLSLLDLLDAGPAVATSWDRITPAVPLNHRIDSIRPVAPPQLKELLSNLADDMGEQSPKDLPQLPQESAGRRTADQIANAFFKVIGGAAGALSGSGSAWKKLAEWAQRHGDSISKTLEDARAKELNRLMKMLESDPDNGLRFALPLFGDSNRGTAPPGSRLGPRNANFNLGKLFSSQAADGWDIQQQMQERLRHRYRELAARELGLRRYGRAAYIFANLLGDFHAAASALQQGKLWREAAILHRDKLKDNRRAAACLEEGGLLTEAIEIYLQLQLHEHVAGLYLKLDRPDEATQAYRTAVREAMTKDDILQAAKLLETRLGAADEALDALTRAWPHSKQAVSCACEAFGLLARLDRHDESLVRIEQMRNHARQPSNVFNTIQVAAHVATAYPAVPVRTLAQDATRLLAGHAIPGATTEQVRTLLRFVEEAGSGDRLLRRDNERYLTLHKPPTPKARPLLPERTLRQDGPAPKVVRTLTLNGQGNPWHMAAAVPGGFVAMATYDAHVIIARSTFEGDRYSATVLWPNAKAAPPRLLAGEPVIALYRPGDCPEIHPVSLPAVGKMRPATIRTYSRSMGLFAGLARSCDGNTHWLGLTDGGSALTHNVQNAASLIDTADTDIVLSEQATLDSMHYLARADAQVFTAGQTLYLIRRDRPSLKLDLPGRPRRMNGALTHHTAIRVTVDFETGSAVVWPLFNLVKPFAVDMVNPVSLIMNNGLIFASDATEARLYLLDSREPRRIATFKPDPDVVAWLPLDKAGAFASLAAGGKMTIYETI